MVLTSLFVGTGSVWLTSRFILRPRESRRSVVPREVFDSWPAIRQRVYLQNPSRGQRCACRRWCVSYGPVLGEETGEPWEHRPERCCPLREVIL